METTMERIDMLSAVGGVGGFPTPNTNITPSGEFDLINDRECLIPTFRRRNHLVMPFFVFRREFQKFDLV